MTDFGEGLVLIGDVRKKFSCFLAIATRHKPESTCTSINSHNGGINMQHDLPKGIYLQVLRKNTYRQVVGLPR